MKEYLFIDKIKKYTIRILAVLLSWGIEIYRKFKPIPPRIYFCYNQSIHQIYHSLFIAIELSNIQKECEVVVFSTSREASEIIEGELSSIPNNVRFKKIRHLGYNRADFNVNWFVFLCRLRMHRPKAVIVTDYFDAVFRKLLLKTFWVYTFHGPENRGFTHAHIKDYDLIILPGPQELGRLEACVGALNNYEISGYSKFDYFYYHRLKPPRIFGETKPMVIYNPHFHKEQSSFFSHGQELLQALSRSGKYNILFMPHPDLSRKYPRLIEPINNLPNVAVINRPRINLDYMAIADLYITDVSSSVFEWLYFNKPAIFFNAKNVDWLKEKRYPAWVCGKVVRDVPSLLEAVDHSLKHPQEHLSQRKQLFDATFSNQGKNVSGLIAQTIWERLKKSKERPQFFFWGDLRKKLGLTLLVFSFIKKVSQGKGAYLVCNRADISDFPNSKIFRVNIFPFKRMLSFTVFRGNLKAVTFFEYELFDLFASRFLQESSTVYGVQGMALHIFKKAQKSGLKKMLIATTLHIETVWRMHKEEEKILGYDYEWLNARLKDKILKEYELADTVITFSRLTYKTFLDAGFSEAKLQYFPIGIDDKYYKRQAEKTDSVFRLLYVGRLTPQKGVHYLIAAFKELNLPNSELLLFGGIPTRRNDLWLKGLIKGWGNIKVDCGDPRGAYEQSCVLVHPSLNDNTGNTVFEALSYGLPVIVSENTGAKELVKDGQNGFIIPVRDVKAIKEKVIYYYNQGESGDVSQKI